MQLLYRISMACYGMAIRIAALWDAKARDWVNGRRNWPETVRSIAGKRHGRPLYWFHCASYGEFLQVLPLMRLMKQRHPDRFILLSFFSPSGMNHFKDAGNVPADAACYLPLDTPANAGKFVDLLRPDVAVFVKYDLWPFYISALKKRGTPMALVAAQFRPRQIYFALWGGFFRQALAQLDVVFHQYPVSQTCTVDFSFEQEVVGDPRFDQAAKNTQTPFSDQSLDRFTSRSKSVVVFGSAWMPEIQWAKHLLDRNPHVKIIVAPHDVSGKAIRKWRKALGHKATLLSEYHDNDTRVLLIDRIGILRYAYRYASVAVVGGGFSGALHNVIEASAYGIPVLFGNRHRKFPEATELIRTGAAKDVATPGDGAALVDHLLHVASDRNRMAQPAKLCMERLSGATEKMAKHPLFHPG